MASARVAASTASARDNPWWSAALVTSPKWASQRLNDLSLSSIDPVAAFPQRFRSHFSIITFLSPSKHTDLTHTKALRQIAVFPAQVPEIATRTPFWNGGLDEWRACNHQPIPHFLREEVLANVFSTIHLL
jgi:hypothetical protein